MGIRTLRRFIAIIHFALNDIKTKVWMDVTFLGLEGPFPDPSNGILPPIDLTGGKKQNWATLIQEFLNNERIPQKELESLTCRLSFSQTSILGRFGRAATQQLYRKLYGYYYDNSISDVGRITLEWRLGLLKSLRPRAIYPRNNSPDIDISTDAATTAMIMASVVFREADFDADNSSMACKDVASGPGWA